VVGPAQDKIKSTTAMAEYNEDLVLVPAHSSYRKTVKAKQGNKASQASKANRKITRVLNKVNREWPEVVRATEASPVKSS
jgi:hypothetical protein